MNLPLALRYLGALVVFGTIVGCAGPGPNPSSPQGAQSPGASRPGVPKRLTVVIFEIPFALNSVVNATFPGITGGLVRGIRYVEPMVSAMAPTLPRATYEGPPQRPSPPSGERVRVRGHPVRSPAESWGQRHAAPSPPLSPDGGEGVGLVPLR